jgi:Molybdenum cofactor biosynthesis enzyme
MKVKFNPFYYTRQTSKNFIKYKKFQEYQIIKSKTELLRLDCLNPIKAMSKYVGKNETIINIPENMKLSIGVRDSLNSIFNIFNGKNIMIPNIYPVYNAIALLNNISPLRYEIMPNIDINEILNQAQKTKTNIILMINPLHPHGRYLSDEENNHLSKWLKEDSSRIIIYDAVYNYKSFDDLNNYLLDFPEQIFICRSLSKTHLLPLTLGYSHVPSKYTQQFLENVTTPDKNLKIKKSIPNEQIDIFKTKWENISNHIRNIYGETINWKYPETGYLSVLPISYKNLLENNILNIPADIFRFKDNFDINERYSVISCLHENEKKKYYTTTLSNFCKGYDKYNRIYDKLNIKETKYKDRFYLTDHHDIKIGINKWKNKKDTKELVCMEYNIPYGISIYKNENKGYYIRGSKIGVDNLYLIENNNIKKTIAEEAYSKSLKLNKSLYSYNELTPRTLSILPIAKGCQAKCPFCFSHSSISENQEQKKLSLEQIEKYLQLSKQKGSIRSVITGGGEPLLLGLGRICEIIKLCNKYFDNIIMITNGYAISKHNDEKINNILKTLDENGLTVLSVSRHGFDNNNNTKIMYLDTKSEKIAKIYKMNSYSKLKIRWICVLQKQGVENVETLKKYLDWVVDTGVKEICFKELYVASSNESLYYDNKTNQWSLKNQVSLKLVIDFIEKNNGKLISTLPWGSPIYEFNWKNKILKIAAYTEPNVYWERSQKMCRSWNLMADGKCYASLEDLGSEIKIN